MPWNICAVLQHCPECYDARMDVHNVVMCYNITISLDNLLIRPFRSAFVYVDYLVSDIFNGITFITFNFWGSTVYNYRSGEAPEFKGGGIVKNSYLHVCCGPVWARAGPDGGHVVARSGPGLARRRPCCRPGLGLSSQLALWPV